MNNPCLEGGNGGSESASTDGRARPVSGRPGGRDRGITSVLAITLLIGIVAVGSLGIFLVGTEMIDSTAERTEHERVESGFVELGQDVNTIALSSGDTREVDMALQGTAGAVQREETGRIIVEISDRPDPVVNRSIGSIEYRDGETVVAYQAGGVWRGEGPESRMVSAPDVHYRHGTLSFPIMSVTGDDRLSGRTVRTRKRNTIAPLNDVDTVEGKLVTITVRSEYYAGWAEYFRSRTNDAAVTVDHDDESVRVDLGQPTIDGDFESAVVAQGSIQATSGSACIDGPIAASGDVDGDACDGSDLDGGGEEVSLQPIDEAINMTVDAAREDGEPLSGNAVDNGTYYTDDLDLDGETLTIDVSDGDVILAVDGDVILENSDVEVVGTSGSDGVARVYSTGDVAIGGGNGGVTVDDGDPSNFQLYGTSEMHFAIGQGEFTGTVYAPREEPATGTNDAASVIKSSNNCDDVDGEPPDVCIGQGNVDVTGSIVAGPMSVEQSSSLVYDSRLETAEPSLALDGVVLPPALTHLHVVVYEVEISDA